jgi:hypothetical protein
MNETGQHEVVDEAAAALKQDAVLPASLRAADVPVSA